MKQLRFDEVELFVYDTREEMGKAAARDAAACIKELLKERSELNCIFAAAPSQNDFLAGLSGGGMSNLSCSCIAVVSTDLYGFYETLRVFKHHHEQL